jgi:predicted GIY-YIG superfamily endonuclease
MSNLGSNELYWGDECWWVYVLECRDGSYYTGITNDLDKRLSMHNSGKGAKYTRSRIPVKMLAWWPHRTKGEALREEYSFKQLSKKEKISKVSDRQKWIEKEFG